MILCEPNFLLLSNGCILNENCGECYDGQHGNFPGRNREILVSGHRSTVDDMLALALARGVAHCSSADNRESVGMNRVKLNWYHS